MSLYSTFRDGGATRVHLRDGTILNFKGHGFMLKAGHYWIGYGAISGNDEGKASWDAAFHAAFPVEAVLAIYSVESLA